MDDEKLQEIIAGYSLGILEDGELQAAEELLASSPQARALLAEFEEVTFGLALSAEPVEMPAGSLERLRQKAGVDRPEQSQPHKTGPVTLTAVRPELPGETRQASAGQAAAPLDFEQKSRARTAVLSRNRPNMLAYAASLVLLLTSAALGLLWMNSQNDLNASERSSRNLAQLLASPNLRVAELKPLESSVQGTMRVYTDPATDKAYLVASHLAVLPGDKEYEAWLITGDNQARKAGLLGTGSSKDGTLVYELQTSGEIEQYKLVAITIEQKGGVEKSTQKPVMAGNIG